MDSKPRSLRRYTGDVVYTAYPGLAILHRKTPEGAWTLIITVAEGTAVRAGLGPCVCHGALDCPVGAQEAVAQRILRGDHPEIYNPHVLETDEVKTPPAGDTACPACRSDEIDGGPVDINEGHAVQDVRCLSCTATWDNVYRFNGSTNIQKP